MSIKREDVLHKCGWSPFEGRTFRSSVDATIVSGQLAYHHGRFDKSVLGKRLEFDRGRRE
jgi:dihydroorotase